MTESPNGERTLRTMALGWPMLAGVVAVAFFAGRFSSTGDVEIAAIKGDLVGIHETLSQHTAVDDQLRSDTEAARAERFKQLNEVSSRISFNDGRIEALLKQSEELDMRLRDLEKQVRK